MASLGAIRLEGGNEYKEGRLKGKANNKVPTTLFRRLIEFYSRLRVVA